MGRKGGPQGGWGWLVASRCLAILALSLALACGEVRGQSREVGPEERPRPAGRPSEGPAVLSYEAEIVGVDDADLLDLLEASSLLIALADSPPATRMQLERRAKEDRERLATALRSEGYYESEVAYALDDSREPLGVVVTVSPGPAFRLAGYELIWVGAPAPATEDRPALGSLGLETGMTARAPPIRDSEGRILGFLAERGYPLAKVADRKVLIDRAERAMSVTMTVDAGPRAAFGPTAISGLVAVEEDYVRRLLPWTEGETYDLRKVRTARNRLSRTGLFSSLAIKPAEALDDNGRLPIKLEVAEAPHRSIGFGANWSTDVGFGGEVFWEHRNFFGENERLRIEGVASELEQKVALDLRKPHFLRIDQALLANVGFADRSTDAFEEQSATGFAGIEFPFAENWTAIGGGSAEFSMLNDNQGDEQILLFGLPLTAVRDDRDNALDPTGGTRLDLSLMPFTGQGDDGLAFASATLGGAAYYAIAGSELFVLAGRARVGGLVGESTSAVPANKRFYAGGGGSIRGFQFQRVGPLDEDNDPVGGRSLFEVSAELRIRVTDSIGLVPFVDGGSVFDASYPDFSETVRWAGGLGLRYFTGFGPIRADVAVPINPRGDDVDDPFQFYISFGQAF